MRAADFGAGDEVEYVPRHSRWGDGHEERGVVVRASADLVFVMFGEGATAKACFPDDLHFLDPLAELAAREPGILAALVPEGLGSA